MPGDVADLKTDLAPFYGAKAERQAPISRAVFQEILGFHRDRVQLLERVPAGCASCLHLGPGNQCKKWKESVPADFMAAGCDEWQYDQIPF